MDDRAAPGVRREAGWLPGVVDVSVTDYCNAECDFCSFAKSKMKSKPRRFVDRAGLRDGYAALRRRNVQFVNFQGGEPLLHPQIIGLVSDARDAGLKPTVITNGWLLPAKAEALVGAGLKNLLISIDSADLDAHEANRGLKGVGRRIRDGIAKVKAHGIPVMASVTVSKLVRFDDLPATLRDLGFDAVTFSYPRKEAFNSSSLVFSEESALVDFTDAELIEALEAILRLKRRFPVLNPEASVRDIQRHLKGEPERFGCVGGFKYFYIDWALNVWRCEAWHEPMGPLAELDAAPDLRDRCTACIMSCYRDTSTLMHAGVAAADAASALRRLQPVRAARAMLKPSVAQSIGAVIAEAGTLRRLAG